MAVYTVGYIAYMCTRMRTLKSANQREIPCIQAILPYISGWLTMRRRSCLYIYIYMCTHAHCEIVLSTNLKSLQFKKTVVRNILTHAQGWLTFLHVYYTCAYRLCHVVNILTMGLKIFDLLHLVGLACSIGKS